MYNYFTLLDELQEILKRLNSITTCCIIFNTRGKVLLINQAAAIFLKIDNMEDISNRDMKLVQDFQFNNIMLELINGKAVGDVKLQLKHTNGSLVNVNLKVSLFHILNDVFIFQFSEMEPVVFREN
jgi:sensor histidine kinase regulating citrate/malate metabolism